MRGNLDITFGPHFPVQSYYDISGNASCDEAQIVCIIDAPTVPEIGRYNGALINHIWKDHLVLVENVSFKKEVLAFESDLLIGLNVISCLNGWDLPGIEGIVSRLKVNENKILCLSEKIMGKLKKFQFASFVKEDNDISELLQFGSSKSQQEEKQILDLLEKNSAKAFRWRVKLLIKEIEAEHMREVEDVYKTNFQIRLANLKLAIEKGVNLHGKVIVCLSANFVLSNPRLSDAAYDITSFKSFLNNMKFVLINAKSSPLAIENNPLLWPA